MELNKLEIATRVTINAFAGLITARAHLGQLIDDWKKEPVWPLAFSMVKDVGVILYVCGMESDEVNEGSESFKQLRSEGIFFEKALEKLSVPIAYRLTNDPFYLAKGYTPLAKEVWLEIGKNKSEGTVVQYEGLPYVIVAQHESEIYYELWLVEPTFIDPSK